METVEPDVHQAEEMLYESIMKDENRIMKERIWKKE